MAVVDMWTDMVPRNEHRERFEAALDAATAALVPKFAFVSEATTKASYRDRVDIIDRDVERIITAATLNDPTQFAPVYAAVLTQWEADFDQIQFARSDESQRTSAKRGWFRRKKREAAKTDDLVDWSGFEKEKGRKPVDDDGNPIVDPDADLIDWDKPRRKTAAGPDPYATGYEDGSGSHRPDGSEFTGEDRERYDDGYDAGTQQVNREGSLKTAVQHDTCVHCGRPIETLDDKYDDTWFHSDSGLYPCDPSQVDSEALTDNEGDKYDIATPHEGSRKTAAFFVTPEENAANPPDTWVVEKAADRLWHLKTKDGGVIQGFPTRGAAEEAKVSGFFVKLYNDEKNWFAGVTPPGHNPYKPKTTASYSDSLKFALLQEANRQEMVSHTFTGRKGGVAALTLVREASLVHWAVTDEEGDDEKAAGATPTVRDALEQAWDVLNKVLDKQPPPAAEVVTEIEQAADATSDAVVESGGKAPEDKAADSDKPVADESKAPVHPADPQPKDGAPVPKPGDKEAKPDAPVDDAKVAPGDVKPKADAAPPDPKDATGDAPVDPKESTGDVPPDLAKSDKPAELKGVPKADKPQPGDPAAAVETKPADGAVPPAGDATVPEGDVPEAVVDKAEEQSGGDVTGLEPSKMDTGQRSSMTYTMADGTVGDADVTFLREENGVFFFDGPAGEFGIGERDDQRVVDADGNSFAFSEGNAVDEVVPDGSGDVSDINLDAPVDQPAIAGDPKVIDAAPAEEKEKGGKPDFIKDKAKDGDGQKADDAKAPESGKDDKSDDGKKKKSAPPWVKAKASMLAENPQMSPAMAERLAKHAAFLVDVIKESSVDRELTSEMQADIDAVAAILGEEFAQSDWYDAWGAAMGWAFALNDWLSDNGGQTNATFSQGQGGSDAEADEYQSIEAMGLDVAKAEEAEQLLDGLLDKLKEAGRDY